MFLSVEIFNLYLLELKCTDCINCFKANVYLYFFPDLTFEKPRKQKHSLQHMTFL